MKIALLMKKCFCTVLTISILFSLSACADNNYAFTQTEDGNLISVSGTEYEFLAYEYDLCYLGESTFCGRVKGEVKEFQHLGYTFQTGLFSIKDDETNNILIRHIPYNEWYSIYRKTSLPAFDFSVDNCIRFELIPELGLEESDAIHSTCGDGISSKSEIAEFLSDVRSQPNPREAGLYELAKNQDGKLENCYIGAMIYGFFEDEPNLAIRLRLTSYNDLAYSVSIEGKEYVLSEAWIQKLQNNNK